MRVPVKELGDTAIESTVGPAVQPAQEGAQKAKALGTLGESVMGVAEGIDKMAEAADHERIFSEIEAVGQWKDKYVDGPEGALSQRGTASAAAAQSALKDFEALGAERRANLANERQRQIFNHQFASQYRGVAQALNAHVNSQLAEAGLQGYKATLRTYKQDAARALAADDMEGYERAKGDLWGAIDAYRPLAGWDKKMFDAEVTAQITDLHDGVLEYLENGEHFDAARGYLAKYRPEMDELSAQSRENDIRKRAEGADKQAMVDKVWKAAISFALDPATKRFDGAKAKDAFYSLPIEMQKGTEDKFFTRVAREERAQEERDVQAVSRIGMHVRQFGEIDESSEDWAGLDDKHKLIAQDYVDTQRRAHRADRSAARQEQNDLNEEALRRFRSLPPNLRKDMTDEQIRVNFSKTDEVGFSAITEEREKSRQFVDKGLDVGLTVFMSNVHSIGNTYMKNEMERLRFFDAMQARYMTSSIGGHIPTDMEVNQWLADATLRKNRPRRGTEITGSEVWGYTMPADANWPDAKNQKVPRSRFVQGAPAPAQPATKASVPVNLSQTAIDALKKKFPKLTPQEALSEARRLGGSQRIVIHGGNLYYGTPGPGDEEIP